MGDVSPLQLLEGDFNSTDQEVRIKAIKRIYLVADVMGPEAARADLIPFLCSIIDDDDEVLLALAEQCGKLVPLVGGNAHANLILPCLENLAGVDETVVRDMAVQSLCKVLANAQEHSEAAVAMLRRLSTGDWFTSRVSACGVYAAVYTIASPDARAGLRTQYDQLAKDDAPMVRRAVAAHLGALAAAVEVEYIVPEIIPIFATLISDEQDNVRLLAAEQAPAVTEVMVKNGLTTDAINHTVPYFKKAADDASWRVRHSVAKGFPVMAKAVGQAVFTRELLTALNSLLQDTETEVRSAVVKGVDCYVDLLGPEDFVVMIMPYLQTLTADNTLVVRVALSDACMSLSPKLGLDNTVRFILPILQHFLREDSPEVRLRILTRLEDLSQWVPSIADQLLPLVLELGHDDIWRVRRAVVASIPMITEKMGPAYFEEHLMDLYLQAYQDTVCDVRTGASQGLQRLCTVCGSDWICEKILPRIRQLYDGAVFYLHRITIVNSLKNVIMGEGIAGTVLASEVVDLLLAATQDLIPNVRFTAILALQEMISYMDETTVLGRVRPCMTELAQSDPDEDVKYFAMRAAEAMV